MDNTKRAITIYVIYQYMAKLGKIIAVFNEFFFPSYYLLVSFKTI